MKYSPDTPQDAAKYAVGRAAVERYAHDGARLGLGSGTTSAWMVRALGEKVAEGLQVVGVPTSTSTRDLALSLDIPLVDINEETGTTRVWPGTHREFRAGVGPFFEMDPVIPRGSVLLIDYRLFHGGTQNRSPAPRPILYNVYARPWYRDSRNYRKQPPLVISPDELARVRDEHKVLFTEMLVANHSLPPGRATPTS